MWGVFVFQSNHHRWLTCVSIYAHPLAGSQHESPVADNAGRASNAAGQYLHFPCGLICGALTNLGEPAEVSAEIATLPAFKFNIMILERGL